MPLPLPNPDDPSNPGLPAPLFADVDAVRGDQLRALCQLIWGNFTDIEDDFDAGVLSTLLAGYTVGADSALSAADSILEAFEKLQGQRDALAARVAALEAGFTSPAAFTPTIQGGGTLSNVNCLYWLTPGVAHIQGRVTLGSVTGSLFQLSLPASKTVSSALTQNPQRVGSMTANLSGGAQYKEFTLIASGGDAFLQASVSDFTVGLSGLTAQNTSTLLSNNDVISFYARTPIN